MKLRSIAILKRLEKLEDEAELGRLLYVGSTRARRRLPFRRGSGTLSMATCMESGSGKSIPPSGTALAALWPILREDLPSPGAPGRTRTVDPRDAGVPLLRLPSDWRLAPPPGPWREMRASANDDNNDRIDFDWVREGARQAGTFAHRLLHRVAAEGIDRWDGGNGWPNKSSNIPNAISLGSRIHRRRNNARRLSRQVHRRRSPTCCRTRADAGCSIRGTGLCKANLQSPRGVMMQVLRITSSTARSSMIEDVRWIVDFKLSVHARRRSRGISGERAGAVPSRNSKNTHG